MVLSKSLHRGLEDGNCMSERGGEGRGGDGRERDELMIYGRYTVNANVAGWTLKSATRLYVSLTICESPHLYTIFPSTYSIPDIHKSRRAMDGILTGGG